MAIFGVSWLTALVLAHRLPRLRTPLGLPWAVLAEQFGGYTSVKHANGGCIVRNITVYDYDEAPHGHVRHGP